MKVQEWHARLSEGLHCFHGCHLAAFSSPSSASIPAGVYRTALKRVYFGYVVHFVTGLKLLQHLKWLVGKKGKECTSHTRPLWYLMNFCSRVNLRRLWFLDNSSSIATQWSPVPLWQMPLCAFGYLDHLDIHTSTKIPKSWCQLSTRPLLPKLKPTTRKAQ